jgi:hypothetical protein
MSFFQYGLTETVNLRNTYPVLELDCALLILREVRTSTVCHQVFDLFNFSISNLTLSYLLLQGRFYFYSNSLCVSNYSQVEPFKVICQLIR